MQDQEVAFLRGCPQIQVVDQDDSLLVYHYNPECTELSGEDVKQVRGWVLDSSTNKIVSKTYSMIPEVSTIEADRFGRIMESLGTNVVFMQAFEGTLLNVWFWNGKWRLSTTKKLNAFSSRWGSSTSYGDYFIQCLMNELTAAGQTPDSSTVFDQFTSSLNVNKIYSFFLRTFNENRIVCNVYDRSACFFMGTFNRENNFSFSIQTEEPVVFSSIPVYDDITDLQTLFGKVVTMNPYEAQGILIINDKSQAVKLMNQPYLELHSLRGNSPNLLMRYITLVKSKDQPTLEAFCRLYPENEPERKDFQRVVRLMCKNLVSKYIKRYIKHEIVVLPPEQHGIMKELYQRCFVKAKKNVTEAIVEGIIFEYDTPLVHRMWDQFRRREAEFGDGNRIADDEYQNRVKQISSNSYITN